jgi:hypothetical protein
MLIKTTARNVAFRFEAFLNMQLNSLVFSYLTFYFFVIISIFSLSSKVLISVGVFFFKTAIVSLRSLFAFGIFYISNIFINKLLFKLI